MLWRVAAVVLFAGLAIGPAQTGPTSGEVTAEDVKVFLDPTLMINGFDYKFGANFLPSDVGLYSHRIQPILALSHWSAVWADVPIHRFSVPGEPGPSGIGDVRVGWGAVTHENLKSRFTSSAVWMEALAPTGDPRKGTGFGTWVLAPGGGLAFNPTDKFPVYVTASYLHSLERLRGPKDRDLPEENPELEVRSLKVSFSTAHILPKGFYLAFLSDYTYNFRQRFNLFSMGFGVGRALTKNVAINGAYIHRVAGRNTFGQAFTFGISFFFGRPKVKE